MRTHPRPALGRLARLRRLLVCALLPLADCSAPDYTPVGDWAGTASLAADYPPVARRPSGAPRAVAPYATPEPSDAGVRAMQEGLAAYLSALGRLANDVLLPYREDPFLALVPAAAATSQSGGEAIATLGTLLRRATRNNSRAPEMRETITAADPAVQKLIEALGQAVAEPEAAEAAMRRDEAEQYAQMAAATHDPALRRTILEWAALRDGEAAAQAASRAEYRRIIAGIGASHAMVNANVARITEQETVQRIRLAQDVLRRAARALPRGAGDT